LNEVPKLKEYLLSIKDKAETEKYAGFAFIKKGKVSPRANTTAPFWVTTTDTFMSGWGKAEGLKNKLALPCATYEEALIVADNARNRSDQKNVNIRTTKPNLNQKGVLYQMKDKTEYPNWYQKGYFHKSVK
jgi:hypothetical protein